MIWTTPQILQLVLPVFLVILAGYTLRRVGILTADADRSLLGVLIKLFIPCLAFDVILGNDALTNTRNLLVPPIAGFLLVAAGFVISYGIGCWFFREERVQRTFAVVAGLPNYFYIPLPICETLFGRNVVGVLLAFNVGVEIAMWTFGVALLAGRGGRGLWRAVLNPPMLAVIFALALNTIGASRFVPNALDTAMHMLGVCALPLGLLISGTMLADHFTPSVLMGRWEISAAGLMTRLVVLPILFLGSALSLPVEPALRVVFVVQAAMPAAVFPIVLAKVHHGDIPTALRVVFATSLAGLITIPLWLAFGLRLIQMGSSDLP